MNIDLTVIFLTVNKVPEKWAAFHKEKLLEATKGYPIITVSRVPMDMPGINLIQTEEISASNIYWQMLKAAKIAETTYIAIAEDDSLYHQEHFRRFRPDRRTFAYNMTRWSVFTWGEPTYHFKDRISNLTMIAPREQLIKALEERFQKYPEGIPAHRSGELGKERIEHALGVSINRMIKFNTTIAVVNFNHVNSIDEREVNQTKRRGFLRAYDIPYWGHVNELTKKFQ